MNKKHLSMSCATVCKATMTHRNSRPEQHACSLGRRGMTAGCCRTRQYTGWPEQDYDVSYSRPSSNKQMFQTLCKWPGSFAYSMDMAVRWRFQRTLYQSQDQNTIYTPTQSPRRALWQAYAGQFIAVSYSQLWTMTSHIPRVPLTRKHY